MALTTGQRHSRPLSCDDATLTISAAQLDQRTRHGHVTIYDPEHHQLVVFGGRTAERKRLDDSYLLDLESWAWKKAVCEGQGPSPREGAAGDYHAGHLVVFGTYLLVG